MNTQDSTVGQSISILLFSRNLGHYFILVIPYKPLYGTGPLPGLPVPKQNKNIHLTWDLNKPNPKPNSKRKLTSSKNKYPHPLPPNKNPLRGLNSRPIPHINLHLTKCAMCSRLTVSNIHTGCAYILFHRPYAKRHVLIFIIHKHWIKWIVCITWKKN